MYEKLNISHVSSHLLSLLWLYHVFKFGSAYGAGVIQPITYVVNLSRVSPDIDLDLTFF